LVIGHEAEVANADEALREHVYKESTDKLISRDCHQTLLVPASVIPPTEGDGVAIEGDQAVIRDGDAVCVASQIAKNLLGTTESRLGVNNPVLTE
jgi:hypothetical protein